MEQISLDNWSFRTSATLVASLAIGHHIQETLISLASTLDISLSPSWLLSSYPTPTLDTLTLYHCTYDTVIYTLFLVFGFSF
jgi:hypothetical protein